MLLHALNDAYVLTLHCLRADGATGQSGGRSNMEELGDIFGGGTASASAAATAHVCRIILLCFQSLQFQSAQ